MLDLLNFKYFGNLRQIPKNLQVIEIYGTLESLVRDINSTMATLVLGTILNVLIHFSRLIIAIMDSRDLASRIHTIVQSGWVITFLLYAAEAEEKVSNLVNY